MTYFGRERAMENKFNSMKTGLITGIAGQDGSYLAELLLARGYRVVGAVRNVQRTSGLLSSSLMSRLELVKWDMLN